MVDPDGRAEILRIWLGKKPLAIRPKSSSSPRQLPEDKLQNNPPCVCGVTSSVFATDTADTSGFAITSSTSSAKFDEVWHLFGFRLNRARQREPAMLFQNASSRP